MFDSSFKILFFILGICVVIYIIGIVSRRRFKQKLAGYWGSSNRLAKADSEASLCESLLLEMELQSYDSLVDDQTWSDLDLYDIFSKIDAGAQSSLGSEYLYSKLRLQRFEADPIFEQLQSYLKNHPKERLDLQVLFAQLGKKNYNHAKKLVLQPIKPNYWWPLYILLGLLPIISLGLIFVAGSLGLVLFLTSLVVNIIFSAMTRWSLSMKLENMSYLVRIFYIADKMKGLNFPGQEYLKSSIKPFRAARVFGSVFQNQTGGSELEIILLYLNMIFLIPQMAQSYISRQIFHHQQEAKYVLDILGRLEAAISLLNYKESLPFYCQPSFCEEAGIEGKKLYHPLLSQPVSNDVSFTKNIMISGDNASGKSTYLRTVAINAILAQSLNFACAESLNLAYGWVLTAMDVSDSIETGDSYFIAESRTIKRMLESLEQEGIHYFFIDELFKGTNTLERIGAGLGIIKWLAERHCLYMISSHDVELVATSGDLNDQFHFDSQYRDGEIVFDYQIKEGSALTKNAVNTLESLHYPKEITDGARRIIEDYETSGQWHLPEEGDIV